MTDFSGLIVPTYYVNCVPQVLVVGPCVKIFQAQRHARQVETGVPEVATIWPIADLMVEMDRMMLVLREAATTYRLAS